jgi:hypothetical protein
MRYLTKLQETLKASVMPPVQNLCHDEVTRFLLRKFETSMKSNAWNRRRAAYPTQRRLFLSCGAPSPQDGAPKFGPPGNAPIRDFKASAANFRSTAYSHPAWPKAGWLHSPASPLFSYL